MYTHVNNPAKMPIRRLRLALTLALFALGSAGCGMLSSSKSADDAAPQANADTAGISIAGDAETNHRIGEALADKKEAANPTLRPGYVLDVTVLASGTKEIEEKSKRISIEGTLLLPLLGSVKAVGMTLPALSEQLTELYGEYLRAPRILLKFAEGPETISPWGYVTVLGRVNKPGRVNIPIGGDMSVSMAIQAAGGFSKSARETGITIVRKTEENRVERFEVDLRDAVKRGEEADMRLTSGDVVYVPVRVF